MARNVFFSFHYKNDINRAMDVRNSWVTKGGQKKAGFIDKAEFEKIKQQGKTAIEKWIDEQLEGTSVTVVLIGEETLKRPYVNYEILSSKERNNAIIGVHIHKIKDMNSREESQKGKTHVLIKYENKDSFYFDEICEGIYDYKDDDGYNNLGKWIEKAAKTKY